MNSTTRVVSILAAFVMAGCGGDALVNLQPAASIAFNGQHEFHAKVGDHWPTITFQLQGTNTLNSMVQAYTAFGGTLSPANDFCNQTGIALSMSRFVVDSQTDDTVNGHQDIPGVIDASMAGCHRSLAIYFNGPNGRSPTVDAIIYVDAL